MFIEERITALERRVQILEAREPKRQTPQAGELSLSVIVDAVCKDFVISLSALMGKRRDAKIVKPRHIAMWLARNLTNRSTSSIGGFFFRDHATILNACQSVENLRDTNPDYRAETDTWLQRFQPNGSEHVNRKS